MPGHDHADPATNHDRRLGPATLALRLLAPYLAVGIFWIGLQDAWLTVLAYHAQILLWTRGRVTLPWRRPDRWLLALLPFALAGPVLLLVLPWSAVTDLSAWLAGYGLSGWALWAMVPYYGLVHPVLEQAHWAPLRRRTRLADLVFAAYHLLVLGTLLASPWLALLLVVLTGASATWRVLERRTGDGRLSVLTHLVADLGVVLVAWWWVVSGRP